MKAATLSQDATHDATHSAFHQLPVTPGDESHVTITQRLCGVRVLVIGGDIASLVAAWELVDRGCRVTIVHDGSLPAAWQSLSEHEIPDEMLRRWSLVANRRLADLANGARATGVSMQAGEPTVDATSFQAWLRGLLSSREEAHFVDDVVSEELLSREADLRDLYQVDAIVHVTTTDDVAQLAISRADSSRLIHAIASVSLSFGCAQAVAEELDALIVDIDHNRMPPLTSLAMILMANFLFNVSFYIIIPTATQYARSLGATDLYSGLVIGGITLMSAVTLIPLNSVAVFRDYYRPTLDLAAGALVLGHLLYGIAGYCNSLALLLVGRLVNGLGFTGWLFVKRYCTDPRVVGLRRRTMCTNMLVAAQTLGMVCGPLFGSLFAQFESRSALFNGNTYPAHIMALVWLGYWGAVRLGFQEVPSRTQDDIDEIKQTNVFRALTRANWITTCSMSLVAFTVFFVLGAWESNIPIVGDHEWRWNDTDSGVFIAAGGLLSFAFILPVTWHAKRFQDRLILLLGLSLALLGALVHTIGPLTRAAYGVAWFFVCWGMNLSSTITLSLTSKTLPDVLSDKAAITIQLSNYSGRLLGAIWGTAGESVGAEWIGRLDLLLTLLSALSLVSFWGLFKAHTG
ncbi:hypothetical protein P43SY_002846 [Pythium insidiosum]|uniref:Major facilitator superfamily (MFS) profile domain-containing protein n=1 Tax=Pythium insidiosum TaxID=114742 RepID=A0AAD5MAR6_PYTIN|nr:hypothetical protein P43SY_002846 [Pythium insidiosum]